MRHFLKDVIEEKDSITYLLWSGFPGKAIEVYEDSSGALEVRHVPDPDEELRSLAIEAIRDACVHCPADKSYYTHLGVDCCDFRREAGRCGLAALLTKLIKE